MILTVRRAGIKLKLSSDHSAPSLKSEGSMIQRVSGLAFTERSPHHGLSIYYLKPRFGYPFFALHLWKSKEIETNVMDEREERSPDTIANLSRN